MATQLRVNPSKGAKRRILITIDGKIYNFGSEGAFIVEKPATKNTKSVEVLIRAAGEEQFKRLNEMGRNKLIEEFDPEEEKKVLAAIEKEKEAVRKEMEAYKAAQEKLKEEAQAAAKTTKSATSTTAATSTATTGGNS